MPVRIEGTVVSIAESGNLVTDIDAAKLDQAPRDESVTVRCDEHETLGIFEGAHGQPAFTLIAIIGDSRCLELEIVNDSAKIMLAVAVGQQVEVCW